LSINLLPCICLLHGLDDIKRLSFRAMIKSKLSSRYDWLLMAACAR
jgi:hypothetical protein